MRNGSREKQVREKIHPPPSPVLAINSPFPHPAFSFSNSTLLFCYDCFSKVNKLFESKSNTCTWQGKCDIFNRVFSRKVRFSSQQISSLLPKGNYDY